MGAPLRTSRRVLVCAAAALAAVTPAAGAATVRNGSAYVHVDERTVVLGNGAVERRFDRRAFRTTALVDRRGRDRAWGGVARDFTLELTGAEIGSEAFRVGGVSAARIRRGGLAVTMALDGPLSVTRTVSVYPDVAGFRTETSVRAPDTITLRGATLEQAQAGAAAPTLHALRAGADFREPGYKGAPVVVGDPHAGSWRDTRTARRGQALEGAGHWLSAQEAGRSLFLVSERNDFPSSRAAYDGRTARVRLDFTKDILSLGPLEENAHLENPSSGQGRQRTLRSSVPLRLEPTFLGLARNADDEPWQFHKYLVRHRLLPYRKEVTFNSYRTQDGSRSTGSSDDMDYDTLLRVAPIAKRLGVETFVLDDGWQDASGDWLPNSPQHPDPRWNGDPKSKLRPRFPDASFAAVRRAIAPMKLGLWMSPMNFNTKSRAFREHPEWACQPFASGIGAFNAAQPDEGSNEAGIVPWGPAVIPYMENRVRSIIRDWNVAYFKFDFMVWLDCAGQGDLYDYRESFMAMVDRLRRDHPKVTFQLDETNDYRLFPYESVARGPSWFQNNTPEIRRLLHNLWNPSPYVPAFSLGQHLLGGERWKEEPVGTVMAAGLASHVTVWTDLRKLPPQVVDQAAPWLRFYKRHRSYFTAMTWPLLDDPIKNGWTALQTWNPERARGALLAFRQGAGAARVRIPLRGVPARKRFALYRAPDGKRVGTATSAQLRRGLVVTLAAKRQARVLLIRPAKRAKAKRRRRARQPARPERRRSEPRFTG